jgi:hypothetical protein
MDRTSVARPPPPGAQRAAGGPHAGQARTQPGSRNLVFLQSSAWATRRWSQCAPGTEPIRPPAPSAPRSATSDGPPATHWAPNDGYVLGQKEGVLAWAFEGARHQSPRDRMPGSCLQVLQQMRTPFDNATAVRGSWSRRPMNARHCHAVGPFRQMFIQKSRPSLVPRIWAVARASSAARPRTAAGSSRSVAS